MDCTVIGDSIAVGVNRFLRCHEMAQVGRSSSYQSAHMKKVSEGLVIISLGSNDPVSPKLLQDLRSVRSRVGDRRVLWLVPYDRRAARTVYSVAAERGDGLVDLKLFASKDWIHPRNYREVANNILNPSTITGYFD